MPAGDVLADADGARPSSSWTRCSPRRSPPGRPRSPRERRRHRRSTGSGVVPAVCLTAAVPDPPVPFEPVPESVGAARRYAVRGLDERGLQHLQDDVRTIVSELATNAVLHARTPFTVSLGVDPTGLRVAVTDGSPVQPRLRRRDDEEATTGRGLRIIAELCTAWGVEARSGGKTTWCYLDVAPPGAREVRSGTAVAAPAGVVDLHASSSELEATRGSRVRASSRAPWRVAA